VQRRGERGKGTEGGYSPELQPHLHTEVCLFCSDSRTIARVLGGPIPLDGEKTGRRREGDFRTQARNRILGTLLEVSYAGYEIQRM
jgi:hypothetical protein